MNQVNLMKPVKSYFPQNQNKEIVLHKERHFCDVFMMIKRILYCKQFIVHLIWADFNKY